MGRIIRIVTISQLNENQKRILLNNERHYAKTYFSEFQIKPSYSSIQIWPLYLVLLACNDRNNTIRALIRVSIVETNIIAKKKECSFVLNHTQCVMLFDAKCAYNEAPLDDEHILFSVETLYRVGVYVEAWK